MRGKLYLLQYREGYFFLFSWILQEGQEIVHMIKTGQDVSSGFRWYFFFDFSLNIIFIKIWRRLFPSFFVFESHDMVNESGKNLPMDSEIMIFILEYLCDLLNIIWKRAICRFQKYALPQNLMIVVQNTVIFCSRWSKWPFSTKFTESANVVHD